MTRAHESKSKAWKRHSGKTADENENESDVKRGVTWNGEGSVSARPPRSEKTYLRRLSAETTLR